MGINSKPELFITKDELIESYAWLVEQPEDVRNCASSIDAVVSLYREAKRKDSSRESVKHPSSSSATDHNSVDKNAFNQGLKRLSQAIEDLENNTAKNSSGRSSPDPSLGHIGKEWCAANPASQKQPARAKVAGNSKGAAAINTESKSHPNDRRCAPNVCSLVDDTSYKRILRLKEKFNLSCEEEVMRLAITVAYHKLKQLA